MKYNNLAVLLIISLLSISLVIAIPQNADTPIIHEINYSNIIINETSNQTEYWNTDIGTLGTINATQFNNNGGTLNLDETWVNSKWCELVGCTMTGDLTLPNLTATGIITATGGNSTEWNLGYDHSLDNTQAHSDYLLNTGDTGTGDYGFDGAVTINEAGADKNFRVEGVGKPNALFVQGSDGRIGIGTNSPSNALDIIKSGFGTTLLIKDTYASTDIKNGAVNGLFYISSVAGITVTAVRGRGTLANPLAIGVNDNIYAFDFYAQILDGIGNFSKVSSFGASMDGATNKGFLFFNAGAAGSATVRMKITGDDIEIVGDNFPLTFGAGQEANIYYDGTDLIFNTNATGTGNAWFSKNVSATGFITRTPSLNNYNKDFLTKITTPNKMLSLNGKLDRNNLLEGEAIIMSVRNPDNCWNVSLPKICKEKEVYEDYIIQECNYEFNEIGYDYICNNVTSQRIKQNCINETRYTYVWNNANNYYEKEAHIIETCSDILETICIIPTREECGTKEQEGMMLDNLGMNNRLLISELKAENDLIKLELCLMGRLKFC